MHRLPLTLLTTQFFSLISQVNFDHCQFTSLSITTRFVVVRVVFVFIFLIHALLDAVRTNGRFRSLRFSSSFIIRFFLDLNHLISHILYQTHLANLRPPLPFRFFFFFLTHFDQTFDAFSFSFFFLLSAQLTCNYRGLTVIVRQLPVSLVQSHKSFVCILTSTRSLIKCLFASSVFANHLSCRFPLFSQRSTFADLLNRHLVCLSNSEQFGFCLCYASNRPWSFHFCLFFFVSVAIRRFLKKQLKFF